MYLCTNTLLLFCLYLSMCFCTKCSATLLYAFECVFMYKCSATLLFAYNCATVQQFSDCIYGCFYFTSLYTSEYVIVYNALLCFLSLYISFRSSNCAFIDIVLIYGKLYKPKSFAQPA